MAIAVAVVLQIAVGVAALAVVRDNGRTGTSRVASPRALTPATAPSPAAARQPSSDYVPSAASAALANLGVQPGDLPVTWTDDGLQSSSVDLTSPPSACAPYARVFETGKTVAVHQYSLDSNGNEIAGLSSTVIENPARAAVAAELPAVRADAFAACAEGTAREWLTLIHGPVTVVRLHAEPIDFVPGVNVVGWRATIDYSNAAGRATFGFDIFYVSSGQYLAKVRVALCPCQPNPYPTQELLPGETDAVMAVSQRIAEKASPTTTPRVVTTVPSPAIPVALSDPCQLVAYAQLRAVVGRPKPPTRITTGDQANQCSWISMDAATTSLGIQTGDTAAQFQTRLHDTPQPLAGLGDQAAVDPEFAGKVLVRKAHRWMWVFVQGTANDRSNAINVAKAVLPKL